MSNSSLGGPALTRYGPPVSPIVLLVIGLASFVIGLYTWDHLILTCRHLERGHITCRRAFYVWLGQVKDMEQSYDRIQRATQINPERVILEMAAGGSEFLDGFGPDTASQLNRFIDSNEPELLVERNGSFFFPALFFGIGLVALVLAVPGLSTPVGADPRVHPGRGRPTCPPR